MYHKFHSYFLTIAECRSITRAAEKLYVSQPYLSKYLKALETSVGSQLFERRRNELVLTSAGEAYLKYIRDCTVLDRRWLKEIDEIKADMRGRIALGLHMWRSSKLIPDVLPAFLDQYPHVDIELYEGTSPFLQDLLMQEKLDFCIMNLPIDYEHFNYEVIMREKILLAGSPKNPVVQQALDENPSYDDFPHFDLNRLTGQTLCLMKTGEQIHTKISGVLNHYHVTPSRVIETTNQQTALNLAKTGFCFTFVPQNGMHFLQEPPGKLVFFTVGSPVLTQTLVAVYSKEYPLSKLARKMVDRIKQEYEPWSDDGT